MLGWSDLFPKLEDIANPLRAVQIFETVHDLFDQVDTQATGAYVIEIA